MVWLEEFDEIKGIALEMKNNRQTEVREETTITVATPSKGVKIVKASAQTHASYAAVVQVQPIRVHHDQPRRKIDDDSLVR